MPAARERLSQKCRATSRSMYRKRSYDSTIMQLAGELMYEFDSLHVSTEMILSRRFRGAR
jgi:hypothetical protein